MHVNIRNNPLFFFCFIRLYLGLNPSENGGQKWTKHGEKWYTHSTPKRKKNDTIQLIRSRELTKQIIRTEIFYRVYRKCFHQF